MQNSTANKLIALHITGTKLDKIGLSEKARLYIQFAYEKLQRGK